MLVFLLLAETLLFSFSHHTHPFSFYTPSPFYKDFWLSERFYNLLWALADLTQFWEMTEGGRQASDWGKKKSYKTASRYFRSWSEYPQDTDMVWHITGALGSIFQGSERCQVSIYRSKGLRLWNACSLQLLQTLEWHRQDLYCQPLKFVRTPLIISQEFFPVKIHLQDGDVLLPEDKYHAPTNLQSSQSRRPWLLSSSPWFPSQHGFCWSTVSWHLDNSG